MLSFTMKERKYWPKVAVAMAPSTLCDQPFLIEKTRSIGQAVEIDLVSLLNDSMAIMV